MNEEIAKKADALAGAFRQARLVRAVWSNYHRNQVWEQGRQMNGRLPQEPLKTVQ